MIPFSLPGPQFLFFYLVLGVVVIAYCAYRTRSYYGRGTAVATSTLTADPYAVAFLRGGRAEALKVALFNLVDRGILDVDDGRLSLKRKNNSEALRRDLDRVLVERAREAGRVVTVIADPKVIAACDAYKRELESYGLMPDKREIAARSRIFLAAAGLLLGVAGVKLAIALAQGRSNVVFLILLAVALVIGVGLACSCDVTAKGREALAGVQTLLTRAKRNSSRLRAGSASNEAVLLAAAFGLAVLPASAFPMIEQMFPKPVQSSDGSSGSDGGSSCGSSSSCGGGGGCGGCGGS